MKADIRRSSLALLGLSAMAAAVLAYPPPPPDPALPASKVPVAVQQLRRDMNDADINALTFHNMDEIFTTRSVPRSGPVWSLPRADRAPDFRYALQGSSYGIEQFLDRTFTNALLILKDGQIVTEIYRNNTSEHTRFIGWSMTKSITSLLIGIALQEGRIKSLDEPVTRYIPELKGGGYDGATIRQVLQMRSGVDYEERYDFANPGIAASNHENALVKNVVRFADAGIKVKRKQPPGQGWEYKTLDTAILGWLLERVSGGSTVAAYTAQRLWEPLGAEADGFYILDGEPGVGREFSGAGFNATLRDFGRIGQLMLNEGKGPGGRQIVPAEWIRESTRPTGGPGPGYGYQWWTVANSSAYQAVGLQGQFIYVDPATRTVVVKLSYFPPDDTRSSAEAAAFFAAASAWKPAGTGR